MITTGRDGKSDTASFSGGSVASRGIKLAAERARQGPGGNPGGYLSPAPKGEGKTSGVFYAKDGFAYLPNPQGGDPICKGPLNDPKVVRYVRENGLTAQIYLPGKPLPVAPRPIPVAPLQGVGASPTQAPDYVQHPDLSPHNIEVDLKYCEQDIPAVRREMQAFLDSPLRIANLVVGGPLRMLNIFGPKPPSLSELDTALSRIGESRKALADGKPQDARQLADKAVAAVRTARSHFGHYRDGMYDEAETNRHVFEGIRDGAKYAEMGLAVLAAAPVAAAGAVVTAEGATAATGLVVATEGTTVAATGAAGAGVFGTAVSLSPHIVALASTTAIDMVPVAADVVDGKPVDWGTVATDLAVTAIASKFGGQGGPRLFNGLLTTLLKNPAVRGIARPVLEKAVRGVVTSLISGAQIRVVSTFVRALQQRLAGKKITANEFFDHLLENLTDTKSIAIDLVLGSLGVGKQLYTEHKAAVAPNENTSARPPSGEPPPGEPAAAPGAFTPDVVDALKAVGLPTNRPPTADELRAALKQPRAQAARQGDAAKATELGRLEGIIKDHFKLNSDHNVPSYDDSKGYEPASHDEPPAAAKPPAAQSAPKSAAPPAAAPPETSNETSGAAPARPAAATRAPASSAAPSAATPIARVVAAPTTRTSNPQPATAPVAGAIPLQVISAAPESFTPRVASAAPEQNPSQGQADVEDIVGLTRLMEELPTIPASARSGPLINYYNAMRTDIAAFLETIAGPHPSFDGLGTLATKYQFPDVLVDALDRVGGKAMNKRMTVDGLLRPEDIDLPKAEKELDAAKENFLTQFRLFITQVQVGDRPLPPLPDEATAIPQTSGDTNSAGPPATTQPTAHQPEPQSAAPASARSRADEALLDESISKIVSGAMTIGYVHSLSKYARDVTPARFYQNGKWEVVRGSGGQALIIEPALAKVFTVPATTEFISLWDKAKRGESEPLDHHLDNGPKDEVPYATPGVVTEHIQEGTNSGYRLVNSDREAGSLTPIVQEWDGHAWSFSSAITVTEGFALASELADAHPGARIVMGGGGHGTGVRRPARGFVRDQKVWEIEESRLRAPNVELLNLDDPKQREQFSEAEEKAKRNEPNLITIRYYCYSSINPVTPAVAAGPAAAPPETGGETSDAAPVRPASAAPAPASSAAPPAASSAAQPSSAPIVRVADLQHATTERSAPDLHETGRPAMPSHETTVTAQAPGSLRQGPETPAASAQPPMLLVEPGPRAPAASASAQSPPIAAANWMPYGAIAHALRALGVSPDRQPSADEFNSAVGAALKV